MDCTVAKVVPRANIPSRTIRLFPNLSIACLQQGLDKELALWYCIRAINYWGSGRLDLEFAVNGLIDSFGYSRSTAYRIFNTGDGIFWDKKPLKDFNGLQIKIYGLQKIAKYFDIRCGKYFLEIPTEEFVGQKGSRVFNQRAWIYSSFHKPSGIKSMPISRASITEATSVCRRSQQRYDKIVSIRLANYANKQDTSGNVVPIIETVSGKSRQWLVHKQLGNTYYCRACRGHTGMLRKVNAAVKHSFRKGEGCYYVRRFFTTAKSYIECLLVHDDPYIMVASVDRLSNGRTEWCQVKP